MISKCKRIYVVVFIIKLVYIYILYYNILHVYLFIYSFIYLNSSGALSFHLPNPLTICHILPSPWHRFYHKLHFLCVTLASSRTSSIDINRRLDALGSVGCLRGESPTYPMKIEGWRNFQFLSQFSAHPKMIRCSPNNTSTIIPTCSSTIRVATLLSFLADDWALSSWSFNSLPSWIRNSTTAMVILNWGSETW